MKWPICRPKLLHGLVYVYFICIYVATIATRVNYTLPYRNLSNYNYLYFICTEYKFIMFIGVNSLNDDRCCLDNTTRVDLWDRLDTSVESCSWEKWGVRHECRVSNSTPYKHVRFELELSFDTIFCDNRTHPWSWSLVITSNEPSRWQALYLTLRFWLWSRHDRSYLIAS